MLVGRRRPESVVLAVFLALVGANFGAIAMFNDTRDARWGQVAYVALALDPFYLLSFVTLYPFRRRPPAVRALLLATGAAAAVSVAFVLLAPDRVLLLADPAGDAFAPERVLLIGELAVAYLAAWLLALQAVRAAPTPMLARRAAWLAMAVGVAVVPRMGLLPEDFELHLGRMLLGLGDGAALARVAIEGGAALGLSLLAWALGSAGARALPADRAAMVRGGLRVVLGVVLLLGLLRLALGAWGAAGGPGFGQSIGYGARWIAFGALLVFGILAYEVVEMRRAGDRAIPMVGAVLGGAAAGLVVGGFAAGQGEGAAVAVGLGTAAALAALVPAGFATRGAARALERAAGPGEGAERRLELYRAALEAAWARGEPGPGERARLERDRRFFGVSHEEARALEHVVGRAVAAAAAPLAPGDEASTGLVLGRLLGEGAHGRVFEAQRFPSGERVVVKEFQADRVGPEGARRRLLDEWRALVGLEHPRIVRLLDVQAVRGRHLLVMQAIDGEPLSSVLARGPLGPGRTRRVLADVLDALAAAHARGVVHRDVKPSNILVSQDGRAYVTDFGAALVRDDPAALHATVSGLEGVGGFAGTLMYMAPEQVRGQEAGPPADLYAAGLVAYEALVGEPGIDLRGAGLFDAMDRAARPAVDLARAPADWQPFLARALAFDPAARHASARAMRRALPGADEEPEDGPQAART